MRQWGGQCPQQEQTRQEGYYGECAEVTVWRIIIARPQLVLRRWSKVTVRNERLTFNNGMPFKTSLQSCWVVTIWSSGQVWRFLRSELQPKEGINLRSHYLFRLHVPWGKLLSFARFSCQIFCNQKENIHARVWSRGHVSRVTLVVDNKLSRAAAAERSHNQEGFHWNWWPIHERMTPALTANFRNKSDNFLAAPSTADCKYNNPL